MNKQRRASLEKALGLLEDARIIIEEVSEDERDSYENLPEGLQASERGEQMDEYVCTMEDIISCIEDHVSELEDIIHA